MKEYICKEHLKSLEEYAYGISDLIDDLPTVTDLDISKLVAVRFIDIVNSVGKLLGVEFDDTTAMEIFNIIFSEMEQG